MTDNIKLPPMPEPDHYAFIDGGQGIWIEGGPTGTPFYSEKQAQDLMREAIAAAEKAEPMANSASAQFEAMHARGIVWISTIAAAKLVQKAELADAAMLVEKDALLRQAMEALEALEGFANIINDSQGVKGYHLNGDIAEWDEFDEVDAASNTIEAIRTHLGVKND